LKYEVLIGLFFLEKEVCCGITSRSSQIAGRCC